MILSRKHNFLYIGTYRTGSVSIHLSLKNTIQPVSIKPTTKFYLAPKDDLNPDKDPDAIIMGADLEQRTMDVKTVKQNFFSEDQEGWDNLFIFSFARNPFDLVVSHFLSKQKYVNDQIKLLQQSGSEEELQNFLNNDPAVYYKDLTFENWVLQHGTENILPNGNADQYECMCDDAGAIQVDTIGRFESLQNHYHNICGGIGFFKMPLGVSNAVEHTAYQNYYTDETKNIIATKYARDLDYFNYIFN